MRILIIKRHRITNYQVTTSFRLICIMQTRGERNQMLNVINPSTNLYTKVISNTPKTTYYILEVILYRLDLKVAI